MYRLFGFPTQNTKKVVYVLNELGVDYEFKKVDLLKGENRTEEFAKKTPMGKVPVLQHDDDYLFESGAICRYVANVEDSPLYPANKLQRAYVDQWMDFFTIHLGRWLSSLFFETFVKPKAGMGATDAKNCDEAKKFIKHQGKKVNDWLSKNKYFLGDELSIADLFAYAYVEQMIPCQISFDPFPNLKRWFEEVGQRDSIKKAQITLA